jgi:adenylate kinase
MTFATRELKRAARIILIGAPGVGKGTQTERLLAKFPQLASISSGDLLRENVRNKTPLGMQQHISSDDDRATNNPCLQESKPKRPCSRGISSPTP